MCFHIWPTHIYTVAYHRFDETEKCHKTINSDRQTNTHKEQQQQHLKCKWYAQRFGFSFGRFQVFHSPLRLSRLIAICDTAQKWIDIIIFGQCLFRSRPFFVRKSTMEMAIIELFEYRVNTHINCFNSFDLGTMLDWAITINSIEKTNKLNSSLTTVWDIEHNHGYYFIRSASYFFPIYFIQLIYQVRCRRQCKKNIKKKILQKTNRFSRCSLLECSTLFSNIFVLFYFSFLK